MSAPFKRGDVVVNGIGVLRTVRAVEQRWMIQLEPQDGGPPTENWYGAEFFADALTHDLAPAPLPVRPPTVVPPPAPTCPRCNDTGKVVHASTTGVFGTRVENCACKLLVPEAKVDPLALLQQALADVAEMQASTRALLATLEAHPAVTGAKREVVGFVIREGEKKGEGRYLDRDGNWGEKRDAQRHGSSFEAGLFAHESPCRCVAITRRVKP